MKTIISMLTATALSSVLLTGCGLQQTENANIKSGESEFQIATIQTEPPVKSAPAPVTEPSGTTEAEEIPESNSPETQETIQYNPIAFDKAVFAAVLDAVAGNIRTNDYLVSDPDRDGMSELLVILPDTETRSQNLVIENMLSAGIYYYDATGAENDYFVLDPETGDVFLNENTRSGDGSVISREYFHWTGMQWVSSCLLYGYKCYWNGEETTPEAFYAHADSMLSITPPEDIFNVHVLGTPETAAEAFYQYLSQYFKLDRPVAADIDGNGTTEQVLFVQNLCKSWNANVRNLYGTDSILNTDRISSVHTTCFVLDTDESGYVRVRSENFDRKYKFSQSGGMLFAYDDTNSMQTIQYSTANDGLGKHFMTMMWG